MTRYKIWEKDDELPGRPKKTVMDVNGVTLPEECALVWGFNFDDVKALCGRVTDIRVEDGEITGELVFMGQNGSSLQVLLDYGDARLGGYYTGISEREEDDVVIVRGILRAVSGWVQTGANPGAHITLLGKES